MERMHLFEFQDLEWFPQVWRRMLTDVMSFFATTFNVFGPVAPKLKRVLEKLKCRNLVDLCSGGSGPVLQIQRHLESREHYLVDLVLTDKFPNVESFQRASGESSERISHIETPVDATDVPAHLEGFRTLFSSFHHFEPGSARRILQDAVGKKEGIGIFEYTERNLIVWFIPTLLIPLFVWLTTPFIRPYSWERLLWTYIIPIVPLVSLWDGMVSNLRTYSPDELKQLVEKVDCPGYTWEIGRIRSFGACRITYLLGYSTEPALGQS